MGQYYNAVVLDDSMDVKEVYGLQSTRFKKTKDFTLYNGIKLMEHSWIGNRFTDFFSHLLYHNPLHVAWVGDYSNDSGSAHDKMTPEIYNNVWGESVVEKYFEETPAFNYEGKYLLNHSLEEYINLSPYAYSCNEWIVYPISLLVAIGNGCGGGDYHDPFGQKNVGIWALDKLSIEDSVPEHYSEINVWFPAG